jgi:twitching motility two-component system response regulator PilH
MAGILIVDNEKFTVSIVKRILEEAGHQVYVAYGGDEAVSQAKAHSPDLILMDIMMPGVSGWDAAKIIREDRGLSNTKIVMLSAKQKEVDGELLKHCDGYITKPFQKADLVRQVEEYL